MCVSWTNKVFNWFYKGLLFVAAIFLGRDNYRLNLTLKTVFSKLKVKVSAESGSYTILNLKLDKASIAEYVLKFFRSNRNNTLKSFISVYCFQ